MKTIIRIEHNCGNGLWRARNTNNTSLWQNFSFKIELQNKHESFLTPYEDNLNFTNNHYCAFKSIEQIQQWIEPNWFKEIIDVGFKIWLIQVSNCQEGKYQIIFKKADIISKLDISSLFINKTL